MGIAGEPLFDADLGYPELEQTTQGWNGTATWRYRNDGLDALSNPVTTPDQFIDLEAVMNAAPIFGDSWKGSGLPGGPTAIPPGGVAGGTLILRKKKVRAVQGAIVDVNAVFSEFPLLGATTAREVPPPSIAGSRRTEMSTSLRSVTIREGVAAPVATMGTLPTPPTGQQLAIPGDPPSVMVGEVTIDVYSYTTAPIALFWMVAMALGDGTNPPMAGTVNQGPVTLPPLWTDSTGAGSTVNFLAGQLFLKTASQRIVDNDIGTIEYHVVLGFAKNFLHNWALFQPNQELLARGTQETIPSVPWTPLWLP